MRFEATTGAPAETGADTVAVGLFAGEAIAHDSPGGALGPLVESGEARAARGTLAMAHDAGLRWIVVGMGEREGADAETARVAAAAAEGRAREAGCRTLCWEVPHDVPEPFVAGLVEGTALAGYRLDRYRRRREGIEAPRPSIERVLLSAHHDVATVVREAAIVATAQNGARDLQNAPPNHLGPAALAERAEEIAMHAGATIEVLDRAGIEAAGMGAFAAVARGSSAEPRLIAIRHEPPGASGPLLALVGKAVTFDSGGLSLKPPKSMEDMKYDMSGGAAVLEALGAIARLGLPVRLLAVVGATENLPDGSAVRPGDVVTALDGTTIEVLNTDAEGRLVLADCLSHAVRSGAERILDVATLTGGVIAALGSVHAGLVADDDAWAAEVLEAAAAAGEPAWRLPLHPAYARLVEGRVADLRNSTAKREAMTITAAEFLRRFTGEVPWAHLDIAGVSWDLGRPYAREGGSGWGVRMIVALARELARD